MDAGYVAGVFGLIGAAIGSASSIIAMIIQAKIKDKRDRSKQLTDMSLAEFKMYLDLATSGLGPSAILPPSAYLHHNDLLLKAIESGTYTPERAREISALGDKLFDVVRDIDKQRQKGSGA
jgi:hypothetical protein